MIYFTTFILALFLTQIARALPACNDPIYPESSTPDSQFNLPIPSPLKVTYDPTYDNPHGSLNSVACSNGENGLVSKYPTFNKLPSFPFIGGAYDIVWNSPNCGGCWKITNEANNASIHLIGIDTAGAGFNIAEAAFKRLNGGKLGNPLIVKAHRIPRSVCGF
ncbi:Cerato-platanin-domain-containing protein [Russula ochroleuca]|jgi:hypothetical protein|uniref:Cerato-platanin-domain-containing protein n=1 Tax=Russula ochroleuca TaxID=152965 RepID=A0A9P5JXC0_9AGAM|nr:Cerato-platanin-domain-containing protein [Russula ochroleuca]